MGQPAEHIGQNYLLCHFSFSPAPPSADVVIVQKKSYSRTRGPQQGSVGISAEPQWGGGGEYFSPFRTRMHQSGAVSVTWTVSLVVPGFPAIYSKKDLKDRISMFSSHPIRPDRSNPCLQWQKSEHELQPQQIYFYIPNGWKVRGPRSCWLRWKFVYNRRNAVPLKWPRFVSKTVFTLLR